MPCLINKYTDGMFPMKYFEYIASGLRVVSTPIDFLKRNDFEVYVANNNVEFKEQISKVLQMRKYSLAQIKLLISENTWDARLNKMIRILRKEG